MGRPSVFSKKIQGQIKSLALLGLTEEQIADGVGITRQTIYNWKNKYPKFFEDLADWKKQADEKVVKSLYQRAKGYSCPETKAQWVNDKDGGHWEYAEITRHYPPDPTSMIYWTKNRLPEWSDKQEHQHSTEDDKPLEWVIKVVEADKKE